MEGGPGCALADRATMRNKWSQISRAIWSPIFFKTAPFFGAALPKSTYG